MLNFVGALEQRAPLISAVGQPSSDHIFLYWLASLNRLHDAHIAEGERYPRREYGGVGA